MLCDLDLSFIIQQLDAIFQALVMFSINVHNRSILLEVKFIIRYKIARHHLLIPAVRLEKFCQNVSTFNYIV